MRRWTPSIVDLKKVSSKVNYQLSGKIVQKMQAMSMAKDSPIMLRIFKEEGVLEVWKANASNRYEMLRQYKICAWSGKLGPKVKEGDRQAPEGFYPISPGQMNPNSSYYLAINTGFPNRFDQANGRFGTNLMIHGACSSSGCYSMTDEQMQEIFALSRDAYKGGQQAIQLQALPFPHDGREHGAAQKQPEHRLLEHAEARLRPVRDHQTAAGSEYLREEIRLQPADRRQILADRPMPGHVDPGNHAVARSPATTRNTTTTTPRPPRSSTAWSGMSRAKAERKAIVAKQRVGKELAYAPTGTSLDAGKLMKVADLEKQEARRGRAGRGQERRSRSRKAELDKSTKNGKNVPGPCGKSIAQTGVQQRPPSNSRALRAKASGGSLFFQERRRMRSSSSRQPQCL